MSGRDCSFVSDPKPQDQNSSTPDLSSREGSHLSPEANSTSISATSSSETTSTSHEPTFDSVVNMEHMELFVHLTTTRDLFSLGDRVHNFRDIFDTCIKESVKADYLLHAILAFSARHLANIRPERSAHYLNQAVNLQTRAVSLFNSTSRKVDSSNCVAILLFSITLGHHLLADALATRSPDGIDGFLTHYAHCVDTNRGIYHVTLSAWPLLLDTDLAPVLSGSQQESSKQPRGNQCQAIKQLIKDSNSLTAEEKEVCQEAIKFLQLGFDALSETEDGQTRSRYRMIFQWTMLASPVLTSLLLEKRPEALILLSYYALLLHYGRSLWQRCYTGRNQPHCAHNALVFRHDGGVTEMETFDYPQQETPFANELNISQDSISSNHYPENSHDDHLNEGHDGEITELENLCSPRPETPVPTSEERSNRPAIISAGVWFVVITSFLVLITTISFLTWLWFEDHGAKAWRRLMLSGRATQSITLTGVLIRWAIGSLATITTSMAASIAVERHGVPKSALAEVSIARFTNNGPYFFKKLLPGASFKPWLRISMISLLILVVASQFASTLLVTDLKELRILSFRRSMSYGVGFPPFNLTGDLTKFPLPMRGLSIDYWSQSPSQSEIFAEYSEPGKLADNIDDTGTTLRAFLPIAPQVERESIQYFNGMARIIDTRVVCVPPRFSAKYCRQPDNEMLYICIMVAADLSNLPPYHLETGTGQLLEPEKKDERYVGHFICPVPDTIGPMPMNNWVLCSGDQSNATVTIDSPLTNLTAWEQMEYDAYRPQLLFNVLQGLYDQPMSWLTNATWIHLNSTTFGPWVQKSTRISSRESNWTQDQEIQMTLCFGARSKTQVEYLNITASTTSNRFEPTSPFDTKANRYDTLGVRKQLAAAELTQGDNNAKREILTIGKKDLEESIKRVSKDGGYHRATLPYVTQNIGICALCSPGAASPQLVSPLVWQTFNDVLDSTKSVALAVQVLNTLVSRLEYYVDINSYPKDENSSTIATFELVQAPQQKWGFITLMAIIIGNTLIFFIVGASFLNETDSSFIDNAWHTIAQISLSEEIQPLVERARLAPDKDLENWLRGEEPSSGFVGNVKGFFGDIKRMFSQSEEERLFVRDGVFTGVGPK
ncbi:hypothetical protein F53441_13852 [Fusarium austroafricanum]|uniref:Transcription factor domain-containing protein n=1 Tax=Fusarium austroafricanum TaxID=2364996 RepID=A0A8H4JJJ1_9HYPO|nr:hypothetical protein F53441_13852 [Fusarium austroafricanum]